MIKVKSSFIVLIRLNLEARIWFGTPKLEGYQFTRRHANESFQYSLNFANKIQYFCIMLDKRWNGIVSLHVFVLSMMYENSLNPVLQVHFQPKFEASCETRLQTSPFLLMSFFPNFNLRATKSEMQLFWQRKHLDLYKKEHQEL